MPNIKTQTFSAQKLRKFCQAVFSSFGVSAADARQAADVLITADLRGVDSHGIARLKTYVELLNSGRINPTPDITVVRQTPSTATVDGDQGLGLVVGPRANQLALEKAQEVGSGWVSVRNSNHYGIAGYYVLQAVAQEMIGWSMTNSSKAVAPLWGREAMLGTNPIAAGFPAGKEPPVVIDMATSTVAFGKLEIARRKQQPIPEGWAIDAEGYPTHDPDDVIHHKGAQLPLGATRQQGGHKGYCLAAMVDILSCVLSGANWGPFAPPFALFQEAPERKVGKGIGHFFGAMQVGGFIAPERFKKQMDDWIRTFRSTKPAPGTDGPLIPGDPERKAEQVRRKKGIPLLDPVVEDLRQIAGQTGVSLDT